MKTILTVVLAMVAGQAQALSCQFGNMAEAYNQAQGQAQSTSSRVIAAIGTLDWRSADVETFNGGLAMDYEGQEYDLALQFNGEIIGPDGLRTAIDAPVRLQTHCINGDCGYAGATEMLTFLHEINDDLVMYAYPCQSYPRAAVPEAVALIQDCVDGGLCEGDLEY